MADIRLHEDVLSSYTWLLQVLSTHSSESSTESLEQTCDRELRTYLSITTRVKPDEFDLSKNENTEAQHHDGLSAGMICAATRLEQLVRAGSCCPLCAWPTAHRDQGLLSLSLSLAGRLPLFNHCLQASPHVHTTKNAAICTNCFRCKCPSAVCGFSDGAGLATASAVLWSKTAKCV